MIFNVTILRQAYIAYFNWTYIVDLYYWPCTRRQFTTRCFITSCCL